MRIVVGRQGSSADIQVPSRFTFVSRSHARISASPGGGYVLEDLNSSNGTYVLANGMWEQITRAVVDATTPILLADYQTSIAELLRGLAQRHAPAAPAPVPAAEAPVAQVLPRNDLAPAASAPPPRSRTLLEELPFDLFLKIAGLGDLMRVLMTLHVPMRGIRQLVDDRSKALYQALLAFAAFLTLVPFLHKEVIMRLGSLVSYPIVAQGQAVENGTVLHVVAIVSGVLGFMLMYALPKSLYAPSARSLVVATNIYANMYCAFYISAADLVKMLLWAITGSLALPTIFGLAVMALTIAFQLYIWRAILQLRWGPMLVFLAIGLVFSFLHGFILAATGLVKFA
jgi:FHA domain-containing protein